MKTKAVAAKQKQARRAKDGDAPTSRRRPAGSSGPRGLSKVGGRDRFSRGGGGGAAAADDEDIDEDLAFDSDDEARYGHFFSGGADDGEDEGLRSRRGKGVAEQFDRLRGDHGEGGDDDDGSEGNDASGDIDLSDMLDSKEERRSKKAAQRAAKTGAPPPKKAKSARAPITMEAESLFAPPTGAAATSSAAPLRALARSVGDVAAAAGVGAKATKDAHRRLAAVASERRALLTAAPDPLAVERQDREATRAQVGRDLKKWQPYLNEQRTARHLAFPLKSPATAVLPRSLGAMAGAIDADVQSEAAKRRKAEKKAAAAKQRTGGEDGGSNGDASDSDEAELRRVLPLLRKHKQERKQEAAAAAGATGSGAGVGEMAQRMHDLLNRSGLARGGGGDGGADGGNAKAEGGKSSGGWGGKDGDAFVAFTEEGGANEGGGDQGEARRAGTGYVQKLKAMLGYELTRQKRLKKIKSKTYRRILRKEKERDTQKRQRALELLNPEAARKRLQEKMDKMRAEERATQKHKNTSKWVRHVKRVHTLDDDAKDALEQQNRLHQELMRKADEDAGAEFRAVADDDASSDEEERQVDALLAAEDPAAPETMKSVLWGGAGADGEGDDEDDAGGNPAVAKARRELNSMAFMKRSREGKEKQRAGEWRDLAEDIERHRQGLPPAHVTEADLAAMGDSSDDAENAAEKEGQRKADRHAVLNAVKGHVVMQQKLQRRAGREAEKKVKAAAAAAQAIVDARNATTGRKTFGAAAAPAGKAAKTKVAIPVADLHATGRPAGFVPYADEGTQRRAADAARDANEAENVEDDDDDDVLVDALSDESDEERERARVARRRAVADGFAPLAAAANGGAAKRRRDADAATPSAAAGAADATVAAAAGQRPSKLARREVTRERQAVSAAPVPAGSAGALPGWGDEEDANGAGVPQDYLVARAFARDDVDADFLAAKEKQVDSVMKPQDPNASLPGWGEWGGKSERLNERHERRVALAEMQRKVERSTLLGSRADASLENVIINHDVDLVPKQYSLQMLPRAFATAAEYQRANRQPLGPEWNTASTFRQGVEPRVSTQQGTIIEPLDRKVGLRTAPKTSRRKKSG